MARHRPILARLTAAAFAAALPIGAPAAAHAQDIRLHTLPLQALSTSEGERTLDWRGATAKAVFDLPPGADIHNLRLVITADPGDAAPAPHGAIEVRLNGSEPAVLHPEPYPFTAQVDFPGRYLRPGRNEAVIAFVSPAGDCPDPADGAWVLDVGASQAELTASAPAPDTPGDLDALLRSQFLSPDRIAIVAPDLTADERAAFQVWTAIAFGIRAPRAPRFVVGDGAADLAVTFIRDESGAARFVLRPGPIVEIHAATAGAASALLRDFARAAPAPDFTAPGFGGEWTPEPGAAEFTLDHRPDGLVLHIEPEAVAPGGAMLDVTLNGHDLPQARIGARPLSIVLPAHLLAPGRNRLALAPRTEPGESADLCAAPGAAPPFSIGAMRVARRGPRDATPDLFAFAAGDFGAGARLVLPAADPQTRAAQLRLLAEIARRGVRAPDIGSVSETFPQDGPAILIAPRVALGADIVASAPASFAAILRGDPPRSVIPRGARAMAAEPVIRMAAGAAARFMAPDGRERIIVTEAEGADFAATLDALTGRDMLAAFDGRVMRWNMNSADVQDRGPWRAPAAALAYVSPPSRPELERTLLFLAMVGGLALGWVMARSSRSGPRLDL